MRYRAIWLTALVAALLLVPALRAGATEAGDNNAAYSARTGVLLAENSGPYVRKTCSGEIAVPRPETYIFGLHDKEGACATRIFTANSYSEAYGCAEKLCPDCRIEDITGIYRYGSSIQGLNNLDNYCPKR